jgi:hypothetical protein
MQSALSEAEALSDLRQIRRTMERSSRYSNFAGLSGLAGGVISLIGLVTETRLNNQGWPFIGHWATVIAAALIFDFFWTRRRVRTEDKAVVLRLVRRMAVAALPGLIAGLAVTLSFVSLGRASELYPYWMLSYGVAMSSVALMSPPEVSWLARSFLVLGTITLALQTAGFRAASMVGFAISFGLLHILYGVYVGAREGW